MESTTSLLEPKRNTVTDRHAGNLTYEVARHRCRCSFCPSCARRVGAKLREKLIPILGTFRGLMLWSFTVDPTLFASPRDAYFYLRERRCLARMIQDLWRGGYLHSRRYFYVVEWQEHTQQAHFHVLLDASYIPWSFVLASWSKHRPATAGPVLGDRPAFGTVDFRKPKKNRPGLGQFDSPFHAACYVTKYVTKTPKSGFPAWVLDLGATTRIRRYSASRGFWGTETKRAKCDAAYEPKWASYRERVAKCGTTVDLFEVRLGVDTVTGEIELKRAWVGELDLAADRLCGLPIHEKLRAVSASRCAILAATSSEAVSILSASLGVGVTWKKGGPAKVMKEKGPDDPEYGDWRAEVRHEQFVAGFDAMIRKWQEN